MSAVCKTIVNYEELYYLCKICVCVNLLSLENWKRPPGRPRITWMKTVLDDLKSHNLTLTEPVMLAANQALWSGGC